MPSLITRPHSFHTIKIEVSFPILLQAIGWKVQEESRRSPSRGRRCAPPGETGLADVLCSWRKEKKNAVTTMFSASLYNQVNNMFVLELCLIQIRAVFPQRKTATCFV